MFKHLFGVLERLRIRLICILYVGQYFFSDQNLKSPPTLDWCCTCRNVWLVCDGDDPLHIHQVPESVHPILHQPGRQGHHGLWYRGTVAGHWYDNSRISEYSTWTWQTIASWVYSRKMAYMLSVIAGVGPWAIDPFNRKMAHWQMKLLY